MQGIYANGEDKGAQFGVRWQAQRDTALIVGQTEVCRLLWFEVNR
jgi:hypothetical protein